MNYAQNRKAGKTSPKPKVTKADRERQAQKRVGIASRTSINTSTAKVIKLGQEIEKLRYPNPGEDYDARVSNNRRLAPTEENLKKWAKKPGRYDLIGVDANNLTTVTVNRKKPKKK